MSKKTTRRGNTIVTREVHPCGAVTYDIASTKVIRRKGTPPAIPQDAVAAPPPKGDTDNG